MNKTLTSIGAALCVSLVLAASGATAQQVYDPMRPAANPLAPLAAGPTVQGPQAELDPELGNLPIGPGAEDTYYQCVACHSTAIIRQQRLTDDRWDYLWTWMIKEQGMQEPEPEIAEQILTYLKTHFSSER
ncbi:cytochrome C-552 [Jannaschia faecimaris]|nr:cytochrome C-552 [Jannaschia faecimaris]